MTTTAPASRRAVNPETAVNLVLIAALVALCLYFSAQTTTFLTPSNMVLMLQNGAALAVIVVPLAFLMISGKVDLSVGSTVGLSGTIAALACTQWQLGPGWAVVLGLLAGVLVGAINGVLCGILQFNPIIVTLGMLGILRGMTMLIQAGDIYIGNVPIFQQLGNGTFIGVPLLVWIALIVFALGGAFITMTPWGRYVYATGVNPTAAYLSALPVRALPFWLYIVTGAAAGLSGIMMTARISGASPGSEGLSMEMDALTVILLGGVAFAGGRGRLLGVLTAWIFLAALQNGLILMNVTPNVQKVASGATLVVAAALDAFTAILWPRIVQRRSAARRAVPPTGPVSESAIPPSVGNIPAPPVNESLPGKVKL